MMTEKFEELYSELNAMDSQEIKNAIEEAMRKGCKNIIAPFEVRCIIEAQQETINRQKAEIERLTKNIEFFVAMLKEHREIVGYDRDFDADIYGSHIRIGIDEFNNLVKETVGDH